MCSTQVKSLSIEGLYFYQLRLSLIKSSAEECTLSKHKRNSPYSQYVIAALKLQAARDSLRNRLLAICLGWTSTLISIE